MNPWIERIRLATRESSGRIWIIFLIGAAAIGFALRPYPGFHDLSHETGPLLDIRFPRRGPARAVVATSTGQQVFVFDGSAEGALSSLIVRRGEPVEVWSFKEDKFQRVWQLAMNGSVLISYEQTLRTRRRFDRFVLIFGVGVLGMTAAIVEYLYRKKPPAKCVVSVWHVNVEGQGVPPYYVAHCTCDWIGSIHDSAEPAREDAKRHSSRVVDEIEEIT